MSLDDVMRTVDYLEYEIKESYRINDFDTFNRYVSFYRYYISINHDILGGNNYEA